jgi:hypothetical protein
LQVKLSDAVAARGGHRRGERKVGVEFREQLAEPVANAELVLDPQPLGYALTPGPPKRLLRQLATAVGHLRSVANSPELIVGEARTEELVDELEERTGQIVEVVRGTDEG